VGISNSWESFLGSTIFIYVPSDKEVLAANFRMFVLLTGELKLIEHPGHQLSCGFSWDFSVTSGKYRNTTSNLISTTSMHTFSDSLFIYRPTMPGYTASSKLLIVSESIRLTNKLPFSSIAILQLASDQRTETHQQK
jgi:hypothetical protein